MRAVRRVPIGRTGRADLHFTPTCSSWLNQDERWFGIVTQQAIRRGSFTSVRQLTERIDSFVEHCNRNASPFVWVATADVGDVCEACGTKCRRVATTANVPDFQAVG